MAHDDLPTMVTSPAKRPVSRKHRGLILSQLTEHSVTEHVHSDGCIKTNTSALAKLPTLLSKSITVPSTAGILLMASFLSRIRCSRSIT